MATLNKVMLIGHLGRDPELRTTQGGQAVCNLNLATDESYVKDGQKVEKTEWHRVVAWGKTAENCGKFLAKGRLVYVEGKLETRKWQDKESGQDRYATEIKAERVQFLGGKGEGDSRPSAPPAKRPDSRGDDLDPSFPSEAGGFDDVPF